MGSPIILIVDRINSNPHIYISFYKTHSNIVLPSMRKRLDLSVKISKTFWLNALSVLIL